MYYSFHQALMESAVVNIIHREFPSIPLQIKETTSQIQLIVFVIPFKQRRKGKATEFINRLQELADQYNKELVLTPSDGYLDPDDGDMNLKQLQDFYKKMGFIKNPKDTKFTHIYKGNR